jgi:uncharacterized protein YlxW (UPF0749 family)
MLYKLIFLLILLLSTFFIFSYNQNKNELNLKNSKITKNLKKSKKILEGASTGEIRKLNNKTFELTNQIRHLESKMSDVKRKANKVESISKASMK